MEWKVLSLQPYSVPSMGEIERIPHNGFCSVSTFSGAGGSSLGFRMAGFRVLWANEFIPEAQQVYSLNHPSAILDRRDIRTVSAQDILDAIDLKPGELDVFEGSPPCKSFSVAGTRHKSWGQSKEYSSGVSQVSDDLFFEYTRLLNELQPKVFVAENVSGLVKGVAKGYFLEILARLKSCGYNVECRVLDGQWLGVPQLRSRTIFIGVRNDLKLPPAFPRPLPYRYSLRDAFANLERNDKNLCYWLPEGKIKTCWNATPPGDTNGLCVYAKKIYGKETMITHYRTSFSKPSNTIKANAQDVYHPSEPRSFTIDELKRICAFPDDFNMGSLSFAAQWERLGRSVPPLMMRSIAQTIAQEILCRI